MNNNGSRSLRVLATIAVILLLYLGAPFFIPFFISLLIAYALAPLVGALTVVLRFRTLAAAFVVSALVASVSTAAWFWSDDVQALWEKLPVAAKSISRSVAKLAQKPGTVSEVKKAAAEVEAIAAGKTPAQPPAPPASPPAQLPVWQLLWTGGKGVLIAASQILVVLFLVFFMLASGDLFKRKLLAIAGETLKQRKITQTVIDEIDAQIRRYLVVLVVTNLLVGLGTWLALRLIGLQYAELWGIAAAVLHTVPYFGAALIAVASMVAAFVQFDSWSIAFVTAGSVILVATLVGSILATWLASRGARMNATAAFVGLLFFGWIWGLWGLLLGIPLLAIVKTICENHEDLNPIGEILGQ